MKMLKRCLRKKVEIKPNVFVYKMKCISCQKPQIVSENTRMILCSDCVQEKKELPNRIQRKAHYKQITKILRQKNKELKKLK